MTNSDQAWPGWEIADTKCAFAGVLQTQDVMRLKKFNRFANHAIGTFPQTEPIHSSQLADMQEFFKYLELRA